MEIINQCSSYRYNLVKRVRRSLEWISPPDIDGVAFIYLVDDLPPMPEDTNRAAALGLCVYGWYSKKYVNEQPSIALHIPDIFRGMPSIYWITTVPTILITSTLAHEVGHHLIAKRGYIFRKGESLKRGFGVEHLCDSYANNAIARMRQRWHYRIGQWAIKDLAETHYIRAVIHWKHKEYKEASEHFYKSWSLNPENQDSYDWHWKARQIYESEDRNTA